MAFTGAPPVTRTPARGKGLALGPSGKVPLKALGFHGVRLDQSGTLTTTTSVRGVLTWLDTATGDFDTDAAHSDTTNPTRITCVLPGYYLMGSTFRFDANATGFRQIVIHLNGSADIGFELRQPVTEAGLPTDIGTSTLYRLAVGDYVEVQASQDSGGNLGVSSGVFWWARQ